MFPYVQNSTIQLYQVFMQIEEYRPAKVLPVRVGAPTGTVEFQQITVSRRQQQQLAESTDG